ncbi:BhlA/UviB family holin-like peptide [Clostridium sp. UBA1056]|uniref:BhlA/UviB family holin-like peptide n=1 Tax=unclassified Clostridium TaxID=2614128 RepID=UPI0032170E85
MENELLNVATSQGIWALLSMSLLFYILKAQEKRDLKQEERENKYQEIISKLTEKFTIVETIKKDIEDIKESILK